MKVIHCASALAIGLGLFGQAGTADAQLRTQVVQPAPRQPRSTPHNDARTPEQTKAALTEVARKTRIPHFANRNGRVVYNVYNSKQVAALEALAKPGSGVLQIFLVDGKNHTFAAFEDQHLHISLKRGTTNWRLRPAWKPSVGKGAWIKNVLHLGGGTNRTFAAMIQLPPEVASNMRTRLAGMLAEQGPAETAGPKWENGHLGKSAHVNGFNCAAEWCAMPVGVNGATLAEVIGIPVTEHPTVLQKSLESGNDKVIGIGIFGPKERGFGKSPEKPIIP